MHARLLVVTLGLTAATWCGETERAVARDAAPRALLVEDGQPRAAIVVDPRAVAAVTDAATLVQQTIQTMSGVALPIVADATKVPTGHTVVAIRGDESLSAEETRLSVTPQRIELTGSTAPSDATGDGTQQGPYFAALEMLERLGVRWLWPGEVGTVVPRLATVALEPLEYRHVPMLFQRRIRLTGSSAGAAEAGRRFSVDPRRNDQANEAWMRNMRLGNSRRANLGHAFGDWYDRYFKDHPEYFAVDSDGNYGWMRNPRRSKQCFSDPGVIDEVVRRAVEEYREAAHPERLVVSLSPTDSALGYCMCPRCRALDAPDGPPVKWMNAIRDGDKFRDHEVNYVSLTDRNVKFWDRVAERLTSQCPGLLVGGYAYSVYRSPPVHARAAPTVIIGYVGGDYTNDVGRQAHLDGWRLWSERAEKLMWRPNLMREGHGFPLVWATRIGDDIRVMATEKLVAADIANMYQHWGTQGLHYYVTVRMLWNPEQGPRAIVADYCQSGFGAAAPAVQRYFERLEQLTAEVAADNAQSTNSAEEALRNVEAVEEERGHVKGRVLRGNTRLRQAMPELKATLAEAERLVAADSPEGRRLAVIAQGFEFAELDLPFKEAIERAADHRGDAQAHFDLLRALVRLDRWMQQHAAGDAIGVVDGYDTFLKQLWPTSLRTRYTAEALVTPHGDQWAIEGYAYSNERVIRRMQISRDGKHWDDPIDCGSIQVIEGPVDRLRVRFEAIDGWSRPTKATFARGAEATEKP